MGSLGESHNWNSGPYKGMKYFEMTPGDRFAIMLVPNSTLEALYQNPSTKNTKKRPLFSLASSNPEHKMYLGQIADIMGMGSAFAYEDLDYSNSDRDYNDIVFQMTGATGETPLLDTLVTDKPNWFDWRISTDLGQQIIEHLEVLQVQPDDLWMSVNLTHPAELTVYDPEDRFCSSEQGCYIPGAKLETDPGGNQTVSLPELKTGEYRFVLKGTENGTSQLTVTKHQGEDIILSEITKEIEIEEYQVIESTASVSLSADGLEIIVEGTAVAEAVITASAGNYGSITPSGTVIVNHEGEMKFTITPEINCRITDVIADGESLGPITEYTFSNVTSDHSIHALFETDKYTIHASAGANGTIMPPGNTVVDCDTDQVYTIMPDPNCHVLDVSIDGVPSGPVTTYAFNDVTSDHTIHATFETDKYTIKASAGANGDITPSGNTVAEHGTKHTFTITPAENYHVLDVEADGKSLGPVTEYSFSNVTANHAIRAIFETDKQITITASAGDNGNITPSGNIIVEQGQDQVFTIMPDENCYAVDIKADGVSLGPVSSYTFSNITANHTIHAVFVRKKHIIEAVAGDNGNISPSGNVFADHGTSQLFQITPDANYHLTDVKADEESLGPVTTYTFSNIKAGHKIQAFFEIDNYTIEASAGANGNIAPSGNVLANHGANQIFTITPVANYHLLDVKIDGASAGPLTTHTFNNITANHTIRAFFGIDNYKIEASAGPGGSITPSGNMLADHASNQIFTITPLANCHVLDVEIDGESIGPVTEYNFTNITSAHTIRATFETDEENDDYTITASAENNGTIAPSGNMVVKHGENQTFTITPKANFYTSELKIDGESAEPAPTYTFNDITSNHTIHAIFEIEKYTIDASAGANGNITPSGKVTADHGSNQTFEIMPDANHHISDVKADGVSIGIINQYTFENVTGAHTIEAVFAVDTYIITALSDNKGDITPSGTVLVNHGANQAFTITPGECYGTEDILVNGVSVGAGDSHTFENITQNHTIEPVFQLKNYTITAEAGQGGSISPSGNIAACHKSDKMFTITPDPGYVTANVSVDNKIVATGNNSYSFEDINSDHTIKVTFSSNDPVISEIEDQNIKEDESTEPVSFTIDDSETLPDMLTLSASSSNPVLVSSNNIFFGGDGRERTVSVSPVENNSGEATIRVTVKDSAGKTADTDFILTVEPMNDKPTAKNSSFTTDEDNGFTGTLNSDDADADKLAYILVEHAEKGLVKINNQTNQTIGKFTYTPNDNENGTDSFTFKVNDGQADSNTACVNIIINPVNDPPVADAGWNPNGTQGTTVLLDASNSSDIDGEITSYLWNQINGPSVTLSDIKTVKPTFESSDAIPGAISGAITDEDYLEFQLTVTDNGGLESADTVIIYVFEIIRVGDINGDRTVDLQDIILALKVLAGIGEDDMYIEADVNRDGKIGTEDLIYMLQFVSELRQD